MIYKHRLKFKKKFIISFLLMFFFLNVYAQIHFLDLSNPVPPPPKNDTSSNDTLANNSYRNFKKNVPKNHKESTPILVFDEYSYNDSIRYHQNNIQNYIAHKCKNRYGNYGWVSKNHKVIIPYEYIELPSALSDFNKAKKSNKLYGVLDQNGKAVIPFIYDHIEIYSEKKIAICRDYKRGADVIGFDGNLIFSVDNFYSIFPFNDNTIIVTNIDKSSCKLFNMQGKEIKTWPYNHVIEIAPNRFDVTLESKDKWNNASIHGIIDNNDKIIIPLEYTFISWVKGDWAFVGNHVTKRRGLFKISSQSLYPNNHTIYPQDFLDNFRYNAGEKMDEPKFGLMDSSFNVIFKPNYKDITLLDNKGNYFLTNQKRNNRGYGCSIINIDGTIVYDTILGSFNKLEINNQNDTSVFWIFENIYTGKKGLWHNEYGEIRKPDFYRITPISTSNYIAMKNDTSYLYNLNGDILSGPHDHITTYFDPPEFLVAQSKYLNSKGSSYLQLDLDGKVIKELYGQPRYLTDEIYFEKRYIKDPISFKILIQYVLLDTKLNPINDIIFDGEIQTLNMLPLERRIEILAADHPENYVEWIAFSQQDENAPFYLIDRNGKVFEFKK